MTTNWIVIVPTDEGFIKVTNLRPQNVTVLWFTNKGEFYDMTAPANWGTTVPSLKPNGLPSTFIIVAVFFLVFTATVFLASKLFR